MWRASFFQDSIRRNGIAIACSGLGLSQTKPLHCKQIPPPDVVALRDEGDVIFQNLKACFHALPSDAALKQRARLWIHGHSREFQNWFALMEEVVENGPPLSADGPPFALPLYGLPDSITEPRIDILSPAREPTFFGNYPPPDNLDGQSIDLIAIHNPEVPDYCVRILPKRFGMQNDIASYAEVRKMQKMRNHATTVGSIGVWPREVASIPPGLGTKLSIVVEEGGACIEVVKSETQKITISDHIPIAFQVHADAQAELNHAGDPPILSVMSFNLLAFQYMSYSFWNAMPGDSWQELWSFAVRLRAVADRKTKWLPQEYKMMDRMSVSEDALGSMPDAPMVAWERANRKLFGWIAKVQQLGFRNQIQQNSMSHDSVRLAVLAHLIVARDEQPDIVLLQEVGLSRLDVKDYIQGTPGKESTVFPADAFSEKLKAVYPQLHALLETYVVVNASPVLRVRRGGKAATFDNGLFLAKRSLLERYNFIPITAAANETNEELKKLYNANQGKPIVGCRVSDKSGCPILNIFGSHFEKAKTEQNLIHLMRIAQANSTKTPTVVVGDFNAVLRSDV